MTYQLIKVLLVEDNLEDALLIQKQLRKSQASEFQFVQITSLEEAITRLGQESFDIILLDLSLPDSLGLDTFLTIENKVTQTPIVVLTGMDDERLAIQAVRQGAQDYLVKGKAKGELLVYSIRHAIERKRIEEELKQRTLELEALNSELEAFCYTVSHDLRNPLSMVKGMSSLLLRKYTEEHLSKKEQRYIEHIYKSSSQMEQIIDDLLMLSQVKQNQIKIQQVDLSVLVQQITSGLQQQQPERKVEFVISPQIMAQGDPHLLRLALENLLHNAWKYTANKEKARIEFGAIESSRTSATIGLSQTTKQELVYFVQDNGVGFDMQKAHQLFAPFQRLENARKFEGTGIGLATVQRIISRHEGRIWFEAAVNQGAAFYFMLGKK